MNSKEEIILQKNSEEILNKILENQNLNKLKQLSRLKQVLTTIMDRTDLSADAKIIAFEGAFASEYRQLLKNAKANSEEGRFIEQICTGTFGVELGGDFYYHINPNDLMARILDEQRGNTLQENENEALLPSADTIAPPSKVAENVSKSAPEQHKREEPLITVSPSLNTLVKKEKAEIDRPSLRKNKNFSRIGTMFGDKQFCYAKKPGGVEPGFRAIDLNESFFKTLLKILEDRDLPKEYRFESLRQRLVAIMERTLPKDLDRALQQEFSSFLKIYSPKPHSNAMNSGIKWLCEQVDKAVEADLELKAWMYKLDYAEDQKNRVNVNKEALREFVGTHLARVFSEDNQKQNMVCINNGKKGNHFVLACGWKNGLKKLKEFLHNGSEPDYNGILIENINAKVKRSKHIPGLGKNLVFEVAIGDRDGIGKEGQNKGLANGKYYGFDNGKPYEGEGVCPSLRDDFSFKDSFAQLPEFLRSSSSIGLARHYMYRNYSVFYDTALSERMEGVHILRKMITGEEPSEEVLASYPELRDELNHTQASTLLSENLLKELSLLRSNCSGNRQFQSLIDVQFMRIATEKLSPFDLYFAEIKNELIHTAIENNIPIDELVDYMEFMDEMNKKAHVNNQHILDVFAQRLLLTSQEVDLLDKLEKYFSPASVMSLDGKVFLNTMRLDPQDDRIPFQLKKENDGTYTLTTENEELADQLKKDFGLAPIQKDKGLSCKLTQDELRQLMIDAELKYNKKREELLIKPTFEGITLPLLSSFLNHNISKESQAKIDPLWHENNTLSLRIECKSARQVQRLREIGLIQMDKHSPADNVLILDIPKDQQKHFKKHLVELAEIAKLPDLAEFAMPDERGTELKDLKLERCVSFFSRAPMSVAKDKWRKFSEQNTNEDNLEILRALLIDRFEQLNLAKDVLKDIRIVIEDIIGPEVMEKLMECNEKTLLKNIETIRDGSCNIREEFEHDSTTSNDASDIQFQQKFS